MLYVLREYIAFANAMFVRKEDFISYKDIYEYKKILFKNISEKYEYVMFDSSDDCYIKVNGHTFISFGEGIKSDDPIDEKFINDINSTYPDNIKMLIIKSNYEYLESLQRKEEIDTREQEKEAIKTSNDYVEWLTEYLKKEKELNNSDLLYNTDKIKKEDKDNCEKSLLFIDTVLEYANNNDIKYIETEEGLIYYVSYNDTMLQIFIGPMYYHIKLESNEKDVVSVNYGEVIKDSIKQKRKKLMYH